MSLRAIGLLLVLLLVTAGWATELVVDGITVPGLDQQTVAGVSYAPAEPFARALGAEFSSDLSTVSLRLGTRTLELRLTSDPVRTDAPGSVGIDGRSAEGHAALDTQGGLLLPVKTVAAAFGGVVTVLSGNRDEVEVRMPRARLASLQRSTSGGSERLLVELTAHVPYSVYYNERLSTLQVRFNRTDLRTIPEAVDGVNFGHAWLQLDNGEPELRVRLAKGVSHELAAVPHGNGWLLAITFSPAPVESAPPVQAAAGGGPVGTARVMISHEGSSALADLALAVANSLRSAGVEVLAAGATGGARPATGLHLYLAGTAGASSLQFLGDPADEAALQQAVQFAGGDGESVERLRRELLLGVHGDLSVGRQLALVLGQELGLPQAAAALPLHEIVPAAGSGVRLQLGINDLSDPGLPERLSAALLVALETR